MAQVVGYALAIGNYPWQSTAGGTLGDLSSFKASLFKALEGGMRKSMVNLSNARAFFNVFFPKDDLVIRTICLLSIDDFHIEARLQGL